MKVMEINKSHCCTHYTCSSCRKFTNWNVEQMFIFHFPGTIYNNHQFLFLCEYCLFETFVYIPSPVYNFFSIDYFFKAVITNNIIALKYLGDIVLKNKNNYSILFPYSDFPSYASLFYYFLIWYEKNQISQYIIDTLVKNIGIPFSCGGLFVDSLIVKTEMNQSLKSYLISLRNIRLRENYTLSKLNTFLPEEIIEIIVTY